MIIKQRYVIDTNSIIYYFENVFNQHSPLSNRAKKIIDQAFNYNSNIILIIPSIVIIEIHAKWFLNEEFARKFYYEVYLRIKNADNIEIKPIEEEVILNLEFIRDNLSNHDIHDKLILSSAIMLNCPIISTDSEIEKFVHNNKIIPGIIN